MQDGANLDKEGRTKPALCGQDVVATNSAVEDSRTSVDGIMDDQAAPVATADPAAPSAASIDAEVAPAQLPQGGRYMGHCLSCTLNNTGHQLGTLWHVCLPYLQLHPSETLSNADRVWSLHEHC